MTCLLFPGRHHLLTCFQLEYLTAVTEGNAAELLDVNGQPLGLSSPIDTILWAVTSANHSNTRRNPLAANRREVAIEELSQQLTAQSYVYLIDDLGHSTRFAEYLLKKIQVDSYDQFHLSPSNCVVACSTPEVIEQFEELGFKILPVELADRQQRTFRSDPPWAVMNQLVERGLAGHDWRTDPSYLQKTARATRRLFSKYSFGDQIINLHRQPILTEDGDLTETRDYNTYVRSFDQGAQRKAELVRPYIQPGRIADIGCCTGALLAELANDPTLRESDFYGIEVARPLYAECLHRKAQGMFGSENVFFYQQDFAAREIFAENSINTFTTFSITHELESYAGREALLRVIGLLYKQLAIGGRWINVDVVGPEDGDREILMKLNRQDGRNEDYAQPFEGHQRLEFRSYLTGLSTHARFLRFAQDFRADYGYQLPYSIESWQGEPLVQLSLRNACEFLSKKDYVDNWASEMHETFCFWDYTTWKQTLESVGFNVLPASNAFANPWIVDNRYRTAATLWQRTPTGLEAIAYPVTNVLLVAEKSARS